jgi:hypothetical protein
MAVPPGGMVHVKISGGRRGPDCSATIWMEAGGGGAGGGEGDGDGAGGAYGQAWRGLCVDAQGAPGRAEGGVEQEGGDDEGREGETRFPDGGGDTGEEEGQGRAEECGEGGAGGGTHQGKRGAGIKVFCFSSSENKDLSCLLRFLGTTPTLALPTSGKGRSAHEIISGGRGFGRGFR